MPESSTSPRKEEYMNQSKKMALTAYEALDEKKGEEIRIIGIGEISILADYFIIAGGSKQTTAPGDDQQRTGENA